MPWARAKVEDLEVVDSDREEAVDTPDPPSLPVHVTTATPPVSNSHEDYESVDDDVRDHMQEATNDHLSTTTLPPTTTATTTTTPVPTTTIKPVKAVSEGSHKSRSEEESEEETCYDREDCRFYQHRCKISRLKRRMKERCPQTCGFCQPKEQSTRIGTYLPSPYTLSGVHSECTDEADDCIPVLCTTYAYRALMQKLCRKTCGFCQVSHTKALSKSLILKNTARAYNSE